MTSNMDYMPPSKQWTSSLEPILEEFPKTLNPTSSGMGDSDTASEKDWSCPDPVFEELRGSILATILCDRTLFFLVIQKDKKGYLQLSFPGGHVEFVDVVYKADGSIAIEKTLLNAGHRETQKEAGYDAPISIGEVPLEEKVTKPDGKIVTCRYFRSHRLSNKLPQLQGYINEPGIHCWMTIEEIEAVVNDEPKTHSCYHRNSNLLSMAKQVNDKWMLTQQNGY